MYYSSSAQNAVNSIVHAFQHPAGLPQALAYMHLQGTHSPCAKWSFANRLLVALAGHTDARGFRQWQTVGRTVKKGSKASYILSPMLVRKVEKDNQGNERQVSYPKGFTTTPVFGYAQTEGEPLDTPDAAFLDALPLREVAEKWGLQVSSYDATNHHAAGFYAPSRQEIALGVANLSTWTHELIHAAEDRLGTLRSTTPADAEIVAELGGATLLQMLGEEQQADLGGAYGYVQMQCKGDDVIKRCTDLLTRICRAIELILAEAQKVPEAACEAA